MYLILTQMLTRCETPNLIKMHRVPLLNTTLMFEVTEGTIRP